MRGRNDDDPDIWGGLYEQARGVGDRRRRRAPRLTPDASGRLLDAAIGILGSIRTFVDVAEEILEDRRARVGEDRGGPSPWVRGPDTGARPAAEPGDGGAVQDIPFGGS